MTRTIAILNPNATVAMTEEMAAIGRARVAGGDRLLAMTNHDGPPAIQGPADAEASLPGLFAMFDEAVRQGAQVVIVGCFDDTGLGALRAQQKVPLIGLGEAACHAGAFAAPRFAVVTTTEGSVPVIEANIAESGLAPRCATVTAAHVPVLELEQRAAEVYACVERVATDHQDVAIVLGCAGMSAIAAGLAGTVRTPVIDPVRAALGFSRTLIDAIARSD